MSGFIVVILLSRLPDNLCLRRVEPADPGARSADEERELSVRSGQQHDAAHGQKEPVNFVCESGKGIKSAVGFLVLTGKRWGAESCLAICSCSLTRRV